MKYNMPPGYYSRFRDLMVLAQLRGDDGAGIISVPAAKVAEEIKHVNIKRTTWSSAHLVTLKDFDDVTKGDRSALFGHARQPTKGGSTLENVHPHRCEQIILMHNGTMSHVGGVAVPQGRSDSKMIAEYLTDHTIQEFVDKSYGAYCLTWVDLEKQTMNFIRNTDRPLWFASEHFTAMEGSARDAVFWASEAWMLQMVLSRYPTYNKEQFKYVSLPANEHWEFPLNVSHNINEPKITKCERTIKSTVTNYGRYGEYGAYGYGDEWGFDAWEAELDKKDPNVTPPFNHAAGRNTNVSSPVASSTSSATTNNSSQTMFQYIPPEHRGGSPIREHGVSVTLMLDDSKRIAMANAARNDAAKKKETATSAIFPERTIQDFVCKDAKTVRQLITANACVWCSERPVFKGECPPTIYPVRFADDRRDYICEDCISDVDVKRAYGFGT